MAHPFRESMGLWYNGPMAQTEPEPGFLQAFRLFVVTQIVFWVIVGPILVVIQVAQVEGPGLEQATDMTLVERLTLR